MGAGGGEGTGAAGPKLAPPGPCLAPSKYVSSVGR